MSYLRAFAIGFALYALYAVLAGCASPVVTPGRRPPLQWTENGFMPYDHEPLPRQQAAYENAARKSMGISKAEWDAAKNRQAWEAMHPRFAPPGSCRDRGFEAALESDTAP